MVVQVVAGEVGEDAAGKLQTADALLGNGMRRTLHERVLAAGIGHASQEFIELDRIRCGVVSWYRLALYIVTYRREETTLVAHLAKHII